MTGGYFSLLQILTPLLHSCSVSQLPTFVPTCSPSGAFTPVQCDSGRCWCVDSRGHELPGSRSAGWPPRCPSACEQQRASALKMRASMAAGAEVHVPACSEDGDFLPLQCVASRCFCVDANGTNVGPAGGAVSCKNHTKHLTLSHHHSNIPKTVVGDTCVHTWTWTGIGPDHRSHAHLFVSGPERTRTMSSTGQTGLHSPTQLNFFLANC